MMRIQRDALQQALARELGFAPSESVSFDNLAVPLEGVSASLMRLISSVCDDLDTPSSGMAHKRVVSHIEDALLSLVLNAVPNNFSSLLERASSSPSPYYMRRALNYIEAHAREVITLSDLVSASGVSARSLHSGFRTYKQTTPMCYIRSHRLDLAKRDLQTAEARGLSVTDVAIACGFNHLSKFAQEYRLRFGVTPSQTRSGRTS
jgi:AraC-like DNA-binding protein